jgi:hypothetical protein
VPTDGERLATVEAVLNEIRGDVHDLKVESARTRDRLHNLEGITSTFVNAQKENRRQEDAQYKRLGVRIGFAGVLLTLAVVLEPIARALFH